MKKMFVVCAFIIAMFSANVALAETPIMEVSDKSQTANEYAAVCSVIGAEPDLRDVTVEQYLDICQRWEGHKVLAAERVYDAEFIVDDDYWSGPLIHTSTGHMEGEWVIIAVDDKGNKFEYRLLEQ